MHTVVVLRCDAAPRQAVQAGGHAACHHVRELGGVGVVGLVDGKLRVQVRLAQGDTLDKMHDRLAGVNH